jgi:hypothetical protein
MGIFDAFTGNAAADAAAKNTALYQQYGADASKLLGQAGSIYGTAGSLGDQYLTGYGGSATGALQGGLAGAGGYYDQARTAAQSGIDAFNPLSDLGKKYGAGSTLYQDALGINGPEGITRAKAAFTTSPGYDFAVNEATDAAARNAAKLGLAGSGNALDAIRGRAQGIASGEYGSYLDRLGGFVNPELAATSGAASGQAQGYNTIANLFGQQGQMTNQGGQTLASLLSSLGQQRAGLAGTVAGEQAGLLGNQVNVLGNVAGGEANANQAAATAAQQGSQNFWNGLLNLGSTAVKAAFPGPTPKLSLTAA